MPAFCARFCSVLNTLHQDLCGSPTGMPHSLQIRTRLGGSPLPNSLRRIHTVPPRVGLLIRRKTVSLRLQSTGPPPTTSVSGFWATGWAQRHTNLLCRTKKPVVCVFEAGSSQPARACVSPNRKPASGRDAHPTEHERSRARFHARESHTHPHRDERLRLRSSDLGK